jgi:cell division GTPase FtsZ
LVNVDFADVRAIMKDAGSSLMGIGTATGKFKNCNFPTLSNVTTRKRAVNVF